MIATLLFLLLQVNPIIQLNVGDSVQLKPLTPGQSFLPVGTAQTCVDIQGSTVTAIWPGECGINVFSQDANGNWTVSQYPLTFYVPSYQTAFVSVGTVLSTGGWQNLSVGHLSASDNVRAISVDVNYRIGVISGFNFGLPVTSTILGIEIESEISSSNTGGTADLRVSLSGDGLNYSAAQLKSQSGTNDVPRVYGGARDLWGRTWTATEINNLRVKLGGRSSLGGCRVDLLRVRVYYF